ncbi:TolC family protein [Geothermobacter hydrogeniphilus]|uniref:TolC family protein n=1 Tax=Geothermobacter hydrogeniphilus TaxID=1969733 RepID=A0A2K2HB54_9BACT|nr:TolC family protein [Geothermobacter hydrogeniphilus]PNU20469.1 TolC family protein [Geothermobacter hydrogeniphilus]
MFLHRLVSLGVVCLGFIFTAPVLAGEPGSKPNSLGKNYPVFEIPRENRDNRQGADVPATVGDLSLSQALRLTMRYNPKLASAAWNSEAGAGRELQAGLLPNPDFSIEMENFAGEDEMSGYAAAETTFSISQLLELGGKRDKRKQVARLGKELLDWDREAIRLDVFTAATKAYIEVVAAQQRVAQAEVLAELADAVRRAVRERVEAGKVSPLELTRAGVEYSAARLNSAKARRTLEAARKTLVSFWGATRAKFGKASGDLKVAPGLPPFEQLLRTIDNNPDLARWQTELEQRRSERRLADAGAVPDLTVMVGVRNFQDTGDNALVAELAIPLPLFDRNQGGRKQATASYYRARHQRQEAKNRIEAALSVAYQQLRSAHDELRVLKKELLPGAEQAFEAANFGYREGKFGFLQVVDAQRTLFEVRGQYVDALANYNTARADIERLIASPLADFSPEPEKQD